MEKVKKNLIYFIMAVALATAFFIHESVTPYPEEIQNLRLEWKDDKKNRTIALENLKIAGKHLPEYELYLIEKLRTEESFNSLNIAKEKERFLEFETFQQFLGELGWAMGLFIYSLFNLIISYYRKNDTLFGEVVLHTTLILISIFFIRWAFKPQDFLKFEYIAVNIICALLLCFGAYFFSAIKNKNI